MTHNPDAITVVYRPDAEARSHPYRFQVHIGGWMSWLDAEDVVRLRDQCQAAIDARVRALKPPQPDTDEYPPPLDPLVYHCEVCGWAGVSGIQDTLLDCVCCPTCWQTGGVIPVVQKPLSHVPREEK
jgi:hypothetical protein